MISRRDKYPVKNIAVVTELFCFQIHYDNVRYINTSGYMHLYIQNLLLPLLPITNFPI